MPHVNLLSLNLHCMAEADIPTKQRRIVQTILDHNIDIVFLQEVAQSEDSPYIRDRIRIDNYAYRLQQKLLSKGSFYYLYYQPFKKAFGTYEEGLAFLSRTEMSLYAFERISKLDKFEDWHTRYLLAYRTLIHQQEFILGNTHFGWTDGNEVFEDQFDQACRYLPMDKPTILAGDFNVTPQKPEYQYIIKKGWIDLFDVDEFRSKPTHLNASEGSNDDKRIDYMMASQPFDVVHRQILFVEEPVSDHFGIFLTVSIK